MVMVNDVDLQRDYLSFKGGRFIGDYTCVLFVSYDQRLHGENNQLKYSFFYLEKKKKLLKENKIKEAPKQRESQRKM